MQDQVGFEQRLGKPSEVDLLSALASKYGGVGNSMDFGSMRDPGVEQLTKSFQKLQSDHNISSQSTPQQPLSLLLRKASTLTGHGGKVSDKYKDILKDLIVSDHPQVRSALAKADVDGGKELVELLERVMRERAQIHQRLEQAMLEKRNAILGDVESKDDSKHLKQVKLEKKLQRLGATTQGIGLSPSGMQRESNPLSTSFSSQSAVPMDPSDFLATLSGFAKAQDSSKPPTFHAPPPPPTPTGALRPTGRTDSISPRGHTLGPSVPSFGTSANGSANISLSDIQNLINQTMKATHGQSQDNKVGSNTFRNLLSQQQLDMGSFLSSGNQSRAFAGLPGSHQGHQGQHQRDSVMMKAESSSQSNAVKFPVPPLPKSFPSTNGREFPTSPTSPSGGGSTNIPASLHLNSVLGDLGSKRSRPESMNNFTSFREPNRTRMVSKDAVANELLQRLLSQASETQQLDLATLALQTNGNPGSLDLEAMRRVLLQQQQQQPQQPLFSHMESGLGSTGGMDEIVKMVATATTSQPLHHGASVPSTPASTTLDSKESRPGIAVNTREYSKASKSSATPRKWTKEEDELLREAVTKHKGRNWKLIALEVPGRSHVQCLQRWKKALDPEVVKGHWSTEEDAKLLMLVAENPKNWGHVAKGIPGRTAKQCRERYFNHLDPSIKKGDWTAEEDRIIIEQQKLLGNRWAEISKSLPGRTENSVKIRFKSIQRLNAANASGGVLGKR